VLYTFLDAEGNPVNHSINSRCMSFDVDRLQNIPKRVLISGGEEKIAIIKASINSIKPTVLITDEQTALTLEASDTA